MSRREDEFVEFDARYGIVRDRYRGPRDEYGKPVERTKDEYPYSYDTFVAWGKRDEKLCNGSVYTDRLAQWDRAKYDELIKRHNLQSWTSNISTIEAFLKDYHDAESVKMIQVVEYCDAGGFTIYRLDFRLEKKK